MERLLKTASFLLAACMLGAVPAHVQTADYWAGYAGTKNVPAATAARALTWAETDPAGAAQLDPLGVKTILYSNPNREQPGDPLYGSEEDMYAHDCMGMRARGEAQYAGQVMTNPRSASLLRHWRYMVKRHEDQAPFAAVFNDEASGASYAVSQPCGFTLDTWLRDEVSLQRGLGRPVIYNGLRDFYNHGVSKEIALNASAIGGMMEECYAQLAKEPRVGGWMWLATERTEIQMAREGKYFFCYGRDLTAATAAFDSRMYTYASFLLTYDPRTSVLWEYYKTPSGGHVMPESRLVAWNPSMQNVRDIENLRTSDGIYARAYRDCYIGGRRVGACVAVVNPDNAAHPVHLSGYTRSLALQGSGIFDGGTISVVRGSVPSQLAPLQGAILFR